MKDKLMFAVEVLAVVAIVAVVQSKVMNVPVIGAYLPGYTPRT